MEHLYFPDLETLLRTLTSQRLALLKTLHAVGPVSIRALAKALERDYKNVHTDVQALRHVGLVTRQRDGCLLVTWTRISTNSFNGAGAFTFTTPIDANAIGRFYRLLLP